MKSMRIVALFAILALTANLVLADDCDDGECTSTVSVTQEFDSIDCSGNGTLDIEYNYTQPCDVLQSGSFNQTTFARCSSSAGFSQVYTGDATTCGSSLPSYSGTDLVGVCKQTGTSRSEILWCNKASISTKFKAVKLATNESTIPDTYGPCNATTGCIGNTGTARVYDAAGCNAANFSGAYPASGVLDINMTIGVCYTTNQDRDYQRKNLMATCSNGQYKLQTFTGGCGSSANLLSVNTFPTDKCIHLSSTTWVKFSCQSAASTLVASAPLVFILFVLFLVI